MARPRDPALPLVSIITPCRNGELYLPDAIASVASQDYAGPLEWSVFDDGSTDASLALLRAAAAPLRARGIALVLRSSGPGAAASGVGGACNAAIAACSPASGHFCFLDADDTVGRWAGR